MKILIRISCIFYRMKSCSVRGIKVVSPREGSMIVRHRRCDHREASELVVTRVVQFSPDKAVPTKLGSQTF